MRRSLHRYCFNDLLNFRMTALFIFEWIYANALKITGEVTPPLQFTLNKDVIIYASKQNCHSGTYMRIVRGIGKPAAHGVWLQHIANIRTAGERTVHHIVYDYCRNMDVVDGQ